ncbi:DUF5708 family protein [Streptomyces sp. NPDC053750]|uniref:DUF5708 family protein n=1 Tax=Streptomyces sp. NPDC053750 TaxID=3365714 RepID=UPI0037D4B8AE
MRYLPERNVWEGSATLLLGFVLWKFAGGVDVPVVISLTKIGVAMMYIGGAQTAWGVYRSARRLWALSDRP